MSGAEDAHQSPAGTGGHEGRAHNPPVERDSDLSSLPLNDRSLKAVPEDSATAEAQTGLLQDDPERAGRPAREAGAQYGRVPASRSLPSPSTAAAAPGGSELLTRGSSGGGAHLH